MSLAQGGIAKSALRGGIGRLSGWYKARRSVRGLDMHRPLDRGLRAAARVYARYELPRCVQLLEALLVGDPSLWTEAGVGECRGCWHGYRFRLSLPDFYQRWAFFLSRYHEVGLQLLLRHALRPGDTFVDGGANIGLISLFGAWRVGRRGHVLAFEPNPVAFQQLEWHVKTNGLAQVRACREGLSDVEEELALRVPGAGNLGAGTFCPLPARYKDVSSEPALARTIRLDDLTFPDSPALIVKLDVEGFELRALRGMERLLTERRPLVITEVNREMLIAAGESPFALFKHMQERGYRAYGFDAARAVLRYRRLVMTFVPGTGPVMPRDIAWVHPESEAWGRLRQYLNT